MKVKKNAKYAVACLSSMGLRITPENRMACLKAGAAGTAVMSSAMRSEV